MRKLFKNFMKLSKRDKFFVITTILLTIVSIVCLCIFLPKVKYYENLEKLYQIEAFGYYDYRIKTDIFRDNQYVLYIRLAVTPLMVDFGFVLYWRIVSIFDVFFERKNKNGNTNECI